ncbi:MAG: alpha/beta fold hydrolase, partial [Chloroflexi bacterium]
MSYSQSTISASDGISLFLRQWQPDDEPRAVLVLVHGLGEHAGRYPHLVETLLPQGYAVFGHDHRGFGSSGGRRGDLARFQDLIADLDQIVDLAREQHPALPVAMYGHSMGGVIATQYLAEHQDKIDAAVISAPGFAPGP